MTDQIIRAARIADGISTESKAGHAVSVVDGRIAQFGPFEEVARASPPDAEILDLGDACLTPGLIDGHTHLSLAGDGRSYAEMFSESDELMVLAGAMNLNIHLQAGITTIREHGARNRVGFVLKEGVQRGYIPGPRMLVSGRPITCTGGHFHFCNEVADGPDEVRRSVRRLIHEGADYIKIMASGGGTEGTISGARELLDRRATRGGARGASLSQAHRRALSGQGIHGARGGGGHRPDGTCRVPRPR